MGGGSKKSGRGGGNHGGKRRDTPSLPSSSGRLPVGGGSPHGQVGWVPGDDLRRIGQRMMKQSMNVKHGHRHQQQQTPPPTTQLESEEASGEPDEEEVMRQRTREMTSLMLSATRKQEQHRQVLTVLSASSPSAYGAGMTSAADEEGSRTQVARTDQSLKRFYSDFRKVVDSSEVVLEILDARDPLGCRLTRLEQAIESQFNGQKTIMIVLNKIDLIPDAALQHWVDYFSNEGRTVIAFTAKVDPGQGRLSQNACVSAMFKALRQIGRGDSKEGARKAITVGVIGYPNVGKSSVINALKRKSVVGVGNTPGFTTGVCEVDLRGDIKIIDCPGVIMPGEDSGDTILRNAVKVDQLENPMAAVDRLLTRSNPASLAAVYSIPPTFTTVDQFIAAVGTRRGRIRQGGVVHEDETARMILHDWNDGRIGYYTLPPGVTSLHPNDEDGADDKTDDHSSDDDSEEADSNEAVVVKKRLAPSILSDGLPTFQLMTNQKAGGYHRGGTAGRKPTAAGAASIGQRKRDRASDEATGRRRPSGSIATGAVTSTMKPIGGEGRRRRRQEGGGGVRQQDEPSGTNEGGADDDAMDSDEEEM